MVLSCRSLSAFCCAILLLTGASPAVAADGRSPELSARCVKMFQLWQRYETAHCPNTTGQRAQAEWALYRCQVGDYERGIAELERLLRRNLIPLP